MQVLYRLWRPSFRADAADRCRMRLELHRSQPEELGPIPRAGRARPSAAIAGGLRPGHLVGAPLLYSRYDGESEGKRKESILTDTINSEGQSILVSSIVAE
jgi:hypothetical protein